MAIKKIVLTEDIINVISGIKFERFSFNKNDERERFFWGVDSYGVYGGSYALEDISFLIGRYDEHIAGTEDDPMGVKFPEDLEQYMWDIHEYIMTNFLDIENLVHYYINKGGLTPGTYKCKTNEMIWKKVN